MSLPAPPDVRPRLEARTSAASLRYLLSLPARWSTDASTLPCLVYLHGARGRGADLEVLLQVAGTPTTAAASGDGPAALEYVVVSPQTRSGSWAGRLARAQLLALVDELCGEPSLRIDPQRITLCGSSMGGDGVWAVGAAFADRWAALCPVCAAPRLASIEPLREKPIWLWHGANDAVVPVAGSDAMADALRRAATHPDRIRYTRLEACPTPDGAPHAEGHAAWLAAFDPASELWPWLRAQKLTPADAAPASTPLSRDEPLDAAQGARNPR